MQAILKPSLQMGTHCGVIFKLLGNQGTKLECVKRYSVVIYLYSNILLKEVNRTVINTLYKIPTGDNIK